MPRIARDLGFLIINTLLLAIIAYGVVNNLRVMQADIQEHRLRNEAENLCQLKIVRQPDVTNWIEKYKECVDKRSGVKSPHLNGESSNKSDVG